MSTLLEVSDVSTGYGEVPVVHGLSLSVAEGEIVSLLGANGAGKTTTMRSISGVLPLWTGQVRFDGAPLSGPLHRRARRGVAVITEERGVFAGLSVATNLALGRGTVDRALEIFPELKRLVDRRAGLLSGGEQQMLTLARALAGDARLLLVDELSLGLAPIIVDRLLDALRSAASNGMGILLIEQYARRALAISDRAYVIRRGRIGLEGDASELGSNFDSIERAYLGGAS
jgi:branched-chain amino acid transport system ATP-binding protein